MSIHGTSRVSTGVIVRTVIYHAANLDVIEGQVLFLEVEGCTGKRKTTLHSTWC